MTGFGIQIPPEGCTPAELGATAALAERLGFDWVSVADHAVATRGKQGVRRGVGCLDGYLAASVVAQATASVRCGLLVSNPIFRHPVLVAHAAATLDLLSRGRFEPGLGMGWLEAEHAMFGMPFPAAGQRRGMFEEAAQVIRRMWENDAAAFDGRWFRLDGAECHPVEPRRPLRLWAGGMGGERFFAAVAAHFGGWNVITHDPERFRLGLARLRAACDAAGRDAGEVRKSVTIAIAGPESGRRAVEEHFAEVRGLSLDDARALLVGRSEAELRELVGELADAGADDVLLLVYPPFRPDLLAWAAQAVIGDRPPLEARA